MPKFEKLVVPKEGTRITFKGGKPVIPNDPIVCYVRGDGIGVDITPVMMDVVDAAVEKAFKGKKRIEWFRVMAGEDAMEMYGELMPDETMNAVRHYFFAIKGPLYTPIGGGFRSLNVAFRQINDLYACVRPVRWFTGVPSPMVHPEWVNMCIFRENTEDVYAGIEWELNSKEVKKVINFLNKEMGCNIRKDSGIGVKPISVFGSERIIKKAIDYAIANKKKVVTIVHKGNVQKYTEGSFKDWGYAFLKKKYRKHIVTEEELWSKKYNGKMPKGKILVNDRIADNIFQQVLTRQREYEVLACTNLNGDYISDAIAGQVGGLGMAPGANIGDKIHFYEPTHGTAPKYAGKDMVNPCSLILSAVMMLEDMGWNKAADLIVKGIEGAIKKKTVTYDLHRQMKGAKKVSCSQFGKAIIKNM
ncbi:MAG: isocitrate dehydrogenase (NADP(+)) [Nitrospinota bacterium]|jgi:isocitrate dehydrogenase|nr:isocitrate dehydrogenase (NADP(+)) [Nitrospinota bacterium]